MKSTYSPEDATRLFEGIEAPWGIAGGWGIDLWLGTQSREHEDLDVAVLREHQHLFWDRLTGWDLNLGTAPNVVEPWAASVVPQPRHAVWCRPTLHSDWALEILLNDSDGDEWLFRRDHSVRLPLPELGGRTVDGIPFLRPEIILLYKAKNVREHDQEDFLISHPKLEPDARNWLRAAIEQVHPGHEWLTALSSRRA